MGRPTDGKPQASSLYYLVGGVDMHKTLAFLKENPDELRHGGDGAHTTPEILEKRLADGMPMLFSGFLGVREEAIKNGDYPNAYGAQGPAFKVGTIRALWRGGRVEPYVTAHNADTCFGVMPTDRKQLAAALVASRKFILKMVNFYRKYLPGYENCYLLATAPMFGARESRRIVGDYILTEEDAVEGREFMDAVGRCGAYVDVHDEDGGVRPSYLREVGGPKGWYHVPYRVLLPQTWKGCWLSAAAYPRTTTPRDQSATRPDAWSQAKPPESPPPSPPKRARPLGIWMWRYCKPPSETRRRLFSQTLLDGDRRLGGCEIPLNPRVQATVLECV